MRGTQPGTKPVGKVAVKNVARIEQRLNIPGYIKIVGTVAHMITQHRIKIVINFVKSPDNYAPAPLIQESMPWRGDAQSMRKQLEKRIEEVTRKVRSGELLPKGMFLEMCNTTLDPNFLTSQCAKCRSPHCEISDAAQ